jgi:hypothetical protein
MCAAAEAARCAALPSAGLVRGRPRTPFAGRQPHYYYSSTANSYTTDSHHSSDSSNPRCVTGTHCSSSGSIPSKYRHTNPQIHQKQHRCPTASLGVYSRKHIDGSFIWFWIWW